MPSQTDKMSSLDERIMMAIVRASERFKRKSSAIFAEHGLSFSQYNVLRLLDTLPGENGSITEISRRLLVSGPNMTGIAKRLEKAGFIKRSRGADDERKTIVTMQPQGKEVLIKIRDKQEANIKRFLASCPLEQKNGFLELLRDMLRLES